MTADPRRTALVLSGGGSTGNAWMIGVLAGLSEAGIEVTAADLTIGTSAGSTTAAQVAGADPAELFTATMTATAPPVRGSGGERVRAASDSMDRTAAIIASATDAADMRRRMGAAAIALAGAGDGRSGHRWRAAVAARLPSDRWPQRRLLITAVDAATGEAVTFDRDSGVDLIDAVAASCSSGPAYPIGDCSYIDGGFRRNENADLAKGYERVLVLSPFGGRSRHPSAWRMQLDAQVDELRTSSSRVEVIVPQGSTAERMLGAQAMDLAARAPVARAGHDQALTAADRIGELWS